MSTNFDGTNDRVRSSASALLESSIFSGSVWCSPDVIARGVIYGLLNGIGAGSSNLTFSTSSNYVQMRYDFSTTSGEWKTPAASVVTGGWSNIGFSYDRSSVLNNPSIYINGFLQNLTQVAIPVGVVGTNNIHMSVGENAANALDYDGRLAHVQYFTRALSPKEFIQIMYYPGSVRNQLRLYWPLRGIPTTEPDYSGNGYDGTVSGATVSISEPPINNWFYINKPELMNVF